MVATTSPYNKYFDIVEGSSPYLFMGRVEQVVGMCIEASGPAVSIGDVCYLDIADKKERLSAEVVGFKNGRVMLMPLSEMVGIRPGAKVYSERKPISIKVGKELLGRVLNGVGNPIDGKGALLLREERSVENAPPNPMDRTRIEKPISTGVKVIDAMLTVGKGQRMGIFSGSGVGKSTLLGMITRFTDADVIVIGLVGERGREVKDFIEKDLGEEGMKKAVLVVETGDRPPLMRIRAAYTATTIAEYFRDQGKNVILIIDSVTRVAMAQREVGLAVGEPPATKGYTPSVFAMLPRLLERSGTAKVGSITGFYSVLVESDDFNEPISDHVRAILDGHLMLTRSLASVNHFPAIDVLQSISRVMIDIVDVKQREQAQELREILGAYREAEDLINIGAYVRGSNMKVDFAVAKKEAINGFLRQPLEVGFKYRESIGQLEQLTQLQSVQTGESVQKQE